MLKLGILDVEGRKYTLKIGAEYLIGRKSNELFHDIEIDNQSVDIKHSIIDLTQNSSPQLVDVCSKHGTFVDDLKIPRFKSIPLPKRSKIRFGNVETSLQLLFEGDSGFLEERLNSSTGDTSDIICNTPEHIISSGSRLKNSLKNSITSTPNKSTASSLLNASKPVDNFLIPSRLPRTSKGSNTSARSVDSFYIPETQYDPEAANNRTNNSTDISLYSNRSKKNSTAGDDDFFIPETQEVVSSAIPLSNHARLAFPSDDVNETLSQEDRIPSSQFRICTQDYNGSDENLSNQSDDILANVPLSMVIPPIRHEPVEIDDFVKIEDDDIDEEMSALKWSRKTLDDNADGSVTPDGLFDVVGSVTSDLIQGLRKSANKSVSQGSTPDIFAIPEEPEILGTKVNELANVEKNKHFDMVVDPKKPETLRTTANFIGLNEKNDKGANEVNSENNDLAHNESEYAPTQAFFKPIPFNKSKTSSFLAPLVPEDECDLLPETQVFAPKTVKYKPIVSHAFTKPQICTSDKPNSSTNSGTNHVFALPQASPKPRVSPKQEVSPKSQALLKSPASTASIYEDDLPPTQVFLKDEHVPAPIITNVFSSTLVDCGMELSENSFKTKFNKLLDSDDDEMDELIAPDLVKKMRKSLDKPVQPVLVSELPLTPEKEPEVPSKPDENTASGKNTAITPDNNNFRIPVKAPKTNNSKTPGVSIDNFLLTPDFLGKAFSKNSQLQREAEVNWRNIVLEKQNKALFGDENDPDDNLANIDSDDSEDSFIDLLPKRRETRSKSVNKIQSEKIENPKVQEEVMSGRITRRKSTLSAITITKEEVKTKESKRKRKKKNDTKTADIEAQKSNVAEERKDSKNDKISKVEKISKQEKGRKKENELETDKDEKIENNSKTKKSSKITKDDNLLSDPILGENSSVKGSTIAKSDLVKESSFVKEDKPSKKSSSTKESSSCVKGSTIVKSDLVKESSIVKEDTLSKKSSSTKESSSIKIPSAIKEPIEAKAPRESRSTHTSNSTSLKTSKEPKEKIESSKEPAGERKRTRRKVEEPINKAEEKSSTKSRAVKRNTEVIKSSSKSSKINKLEGIDVGSKNNSDNDKPSPRITRLRSTTDLKGDDKAVTISNNREKTKAEGKKEETAKKSSTTKTNRVTEELIDLTDSDAEAKTGAKKKAKKRKSQEEHVYHNRKSSISVSQSSAESNDTDRTLRRKKKMRIAMTSCSPATREALVRYSGRVWDYTEDPTECDVLILEAGNRTYKLLVVIARGVPVVKIDWLKEVIAMRSTDVPVEKYIFDEPNFQKRHKFVMRDSLQLAKSTSLFSGMNFMMTPNITPKPNEMKDIIVCAGGTVLTNIPTSQDNKKFYLVSENIDNQLWYRYRRSSQDVKVVTAISVMASVMQQSLEPMMKSQH